jgi:hypothetical protein
VLAALVLVTVLPLGVSAKGDEVSLAEAVALRQQLVTAPDFAVAWRALTQAQQRAIESIDRQAVIETGSTSSGIGDFAVAAARCWTRMNYVRAVAALLGYVLWSYEHYIYWCGDGSSIMRWQSWVQVRVNDPLYRYLGESGYGVAGGVGQPFVHVYRSGTICFLQQLNCPYVRYPSVTHHAFGNVDWSSEVGT